MEGTHRTGPGRRLRKGLSVQLTYTVAKGTGFDLLFSWTKGLPGVPKFYKEPHKVL